MGYLDRLKKHASAECPPDPLPLLSKPLLAPLAVATRHAFQKTGAEVSPGDTARLTASEENAIRAWLALIEETDPATIAEVIDQCRRDTDARDYFIGRAAAELPKSAPFAINRRAI